MIRNLDRSREIAQLLVMPEPLAPKISAVNWKRRVQKNEWFPLIFQLDQLPFGASARIVQEFKSEIEDFGINPEIVVGTKPRSSRIPSLLADALKAEHVIFDMEKRQFEDSYLLSQLPHSSAIIVQDFLSTGGIALTIGERLKESGITAPLLLNVVEYENSLGLEKLAQNGIKVVSLTAAETIIKNEDFIKRGQNQEQIARRHRYLKSRGLSS